MDGKQRQFDIFDLFYAVAVIIILALMGLFFYGAYYFMFKTSETFQIKCALGFVAVILAIYLIAEWPKIKRFSFRYSKNHYFSLQLVLRYLGACLLAELKITGGLLVVVSEMTGLTVWMTTQGIDQGASFLWSFLASLPTIILYMIFYKRWKPKSYKEFAASYNRSTEPSDEVKDLLSTLDVPAPKPQ